MGKTMTSGQSPIYTARSSQTTNKQLRPPPPSPLLVCGVACMHMYVDVSASLTTLFRGQHLSVNLNLTDDSLAV